MPSTEPDAATGPALETAILYTTDMKTLSAFYVAVLQLPPASFDQQSRHIGYDLPGCYFGFDQVDSLGGTPPSAVTLWFTVDDLDAAYARALDPEARPETPSDAGPGVARSNWVSCLGP